MAESAAFRAYRLTGNDKVRAFPHEDWYVCQVPRKRLKQLMKRSDGPALMSYGLWLALLGEWHRGLS